MKTSKKKNTFFSYYDFLTWQKKPDTLTKTLFLLECQAFFVYIFCQSFFIAFFVITFFYKKKVGNLLYFVV